MPRQRRIDTHTVFETFTPTTQAKLNFVERDHINDRLVDALRTPGKQVVVYGETGSGKSTLLQRKLEQLYPDHITSRCTTGTTYEALVLDAFDKLDRYYIDNSSRTRTRGLTGHLGASFASLKAGLDAQSSTAQSAQKKRLLPPQLTPQRLGEFVGAAGLCWVIEDFHKVLDGEKQQLAQTFKVVSDLAHQYPDLRIVAVGATETARDVVAYDSEMAKRVAEILVPLMSQMELRAILANGQALLNVDFSDIASDIVNFSVGLASVCHHLALNACLAKGIEATSDRIIKLSTADLQLAVERYVQESSDTLKATFDKALLRHRVRRFDNAHLILSALADGPPAGMLHSELLSSIRSQRRDYPAGNLTTYLGELTGEPRGHLLRRGIDAHYRFAEPLYHAYAQATLGTRSNALQLSGQLTDILEQSIVKWVVRFPGA